MGHRMRLAASLGAAMVVTMMGFPGTAQAHPDHPHPEIVKEDFPGEGVGLPKEKHGENEGHLLPVRRNVTLVGRAEVTNPSGASNDGRVADVFAYGDYAYLNAFRDPTCEQAGVHVIDISNLSRPVEVPEAFIPTSAGSYAGEGIQVVRYDNEFFKGDLLVHQNETCPGLETPPVPAGGISLWDVTDPRHPKPVTLHTGDVTNPEGGTDPTPNQTHSMRLWYDEADRKWYAVLVDDEEATDVDILDVTDPFHPVLINDTLDLAELFGVDQEQPDTLTEVFSHDMMVEKVGNRYVMNMNYWDGGYVLLDVTDPTPGNVTLIAESDFALHDEERAARGHQIEPEGNAHQSELSPNRKFLIGTDEDFNPYIIRPTIDSGPHAGTRYGGTQASDVPPIDADTSVVGPTTFVGLACDPLPPGTGIALVERGVCPFQQKLDVITAAGYSSGLVFNNVREDCDARLTMLAEGTIPFAFIDRDAGLRFLGQVLSEDVCTQPTPPVGTPSASTTIRAVFDGWGYVRLFSVDLGKTGTPGSISQIDTYAIPESQDARYAERFGDLSVHEVAMDPDRQIAYLSYYAGGLRVIEYGRSGIREVGAFVDEGGNNFWGVEVYKRRSKTYILASDRDYGLYIFQYTPKPQS